MGLTFVLFLLAAVPARATVSQDEAAVSDKLSAQADAFLVSLLGAGRAKAVVTVEGEAAQSVSQADTDTLVTLPPIPSKLPGYHVNDTRTPTVRQTHDTTTRDSGLKITRMRVSVILDSTLPEDKALAVERLLPDFLHLDTARGDEIKVLRAALHKTDWKAAATAYAQSKDGVAAATMLGGCLVIVFLAGLLLHFTAGSAIRTFMHELSLRRGGTFEGAQPAASAPPTPAAPELLSGSIPSLSLDEETLDKPPAELPMLGHRFDFLATHPPSELVKLIAAEPPQDAALLLATLSTSHPDLSALVFTALSPGARGAITLSLAGLTSVEPEKLDAIERRLKHQIDFSVRGSARLGELLSRLPVTERESLLMEVASTKPDVAKEIKSSMFAFEDIVHLKDAEFRRLIMGVPYPDWGLALRGAPDDVANRVMSELDAGTQGMLRDSMGTPHPRVKIIEARSKVISCMMALVASGEIILKRDESAEMI